MKRETGSEVSEVGKWAWTVTPGATWMVVGVDMGESRKRRKGTVPRPAEQAAGHESRRGRGGVGWERE